MLPRGYFSHLGKYYDAIDVLDYFTLRSLQYRKFVIISERPCGPQPDVPFYATFSSLLRSLAIQGTFSDAAFSHITGFCPQFLHS